MYINLCHGKILARQGIPKMLVLCNFLKILMVSDKIIQRAFRIHKTLKNKQNPYIYTLFFTMCIYPNYTLA